jgi:hypothetical protein
MSPTRALCALLAFSVVTTACAEDLSTSIANPASEIPPDLVFRFPDAGDETLTHTEVDRVASTDAPAAVLNEDDLEEVTPDYDAVAKIVSASTWVGFDPTYAYSSARQRYTGNHGQISTTATVTYAGQVLGVQPASREHTVPYLLDFGNEKTLWVDAYVFTNQECGLKVDGSSSHSASWQWFLGTVANWGEDSETTQAFPPVEQEPCQEEIPVGDSGTGGGAEGDGGGGSNLMTCWYLVTFDLGSGDVVDAQFLYCDGALEGG